MRWEDERYVRVYTRDTTDWLCLSFAAQGLFCLLLRKVDRAGVLPLGKAGRKGVAIAIGHAREWAALEGPLDELQADGCIEIQGDRLVIPNFLAAQEAESSDRARARKYREKARDLARGGIAPLKVTVTPRDATVTPRDASVTEHDATVTPSRAVPYCTVPNQEEGIPRFARDPCAEPVADAPASTPPPGPEGEPPPGSKATQTTLAGIPEPPPPPPKPPKARAKPKPVRPVDDSPVVARLPIVGAGPDATWPVTQAKLDEWQAAFPAVDVLAEVRALVQLSIDNPVRRKTKVGAARFFSSNLARKQDRGGTYGRAGAARNTSRDTAGEPPDVVAARAALARAEYELVTERDPDVGSPPDGDAAAPGDERGDDDRIREHPPLPPASDVLPADDSALSAHLRAALVPRRPSGPR